jgi:ketosteroid isomerase-like protein
MKNICLCLLFYVFSTSLMYAQQVVLTAKQKQDISTLIDQYAFARENQDTVLLKNILTKDVDQLVSSGEWRNGMNESVKGMLKSSQSSSGSRKIIVDKIRLLNSSSAIVDARYEIQNQDGTTRRMWSTFIVVYNKNKWKISAIRNMLPQH